MAIINCPECKHEISTDAKICPHCGYQIKKSKFALYSICTLSALAIGIVICFIIFSNVSPFRLNNIKNKEKFNEETNSTLAVHGWEFSIPACFGDGVATDGQVTYQLSESVNEGAILICASTTIDDYDGYYTEKNIGDKLFKKFNTEYNHNINTSYTSKGITGYITGGTAIINGMDMYFRRFGFYNEKNK